MRVLLVGKDDSPLKNLIIGALALMRLRLQLIDITLTELFSRDLDDIHCTIYIQEEPNCITVDRLQQNGRPLILIADENVSNNSGLFISINSLSVSKAIPAALELIRSKLEFLDIMQRQQEISPVILDSQTAKTIETLRENMATAEKINNEPTLTLQQRESQRRLTRQESQKIKMKALEDWYEGKPRNEILKRAGISSRTLDRIIAKAKIRCGVSGGRELISKLQI